MGVCPKWSRTKSFHCLTTVCFSESTIADIENIELSSIRTNMPESVTFVDHPVYSSKCCNTKAVVHYKEFQLIFASIRGPI